MTRRSVLPLIALMLFGLALTANAQNANSCSQSDVQTAVNAASSGGTVTVPSGSCTWSSNISVTKAIHIQGAGAGSTVITYNACSSDNCGVAAVVYSPTATEATKTFELSGFTFQGGGEYFRPQSPGSTTPITGLKVHDNAFNGASHHAIHLNGLEFGVFYKNTFSGNFISAWVGNAGLAGESYPHALGSANYPYFEDNTVYNGAGEFVTETGQGGRLAFRHNTISGYACSGCEVFDIHGDQDTGGGTISSEIYHNTVGVGSSGTYRWVHHRGGQAVIANNTVSRAIGFNFTEYRSWGGNGICTAYPVVLNGIEKQINNTFYFNNLAGGSQQLPGYTNGGTNGGSCGSNPPWGENQYIQKNREYWLPTYGPASSRPATCTADGNTYYGATDTDVIYKCTATNTWSVFFQPYTYPHPLRGVSTSTAPASPTNLTVTVR